MQHHPALPHARGSSQGKCRHTGTAHSHGERTPGEQLRSTATKPPAPPQRAGAHRHEAPTHILAVFTPINTRHSMRGATSPICLPRRLVPPAHSPASRPDPPCRHCRDNARNMIRGRIGDSLSCTSLRAPIMLVHIPLRRVAVRTDAARYDCWESHLDSGCVGLAVITGGAGGLGRPISLGLPSGGCASSSPTPTGPLPPILSASSAVLVARQCSWTPTPLIRRHWSS